MNSLRRRFLRPLLWGALALFAPAAGWTAHAAALRHAATPRASFRSAVRLASNALGARPRLTSLTLRNAAAAPASPPTATPLYSFQDAHDGYYPVSALVQGSDGNFYGTTNNGSDNALGTVFQMTPSGTLKTLASLSGSTGYYPFSGLVEGLNPDGSPNGTFFGTCYAGGPSSAYNARSASQGFGSVFKLAPDSNSPTGFTLTYIYEFPGSTYTVAPQGANPLGSLVPGRNADGTFDGFYYGTTQLGGDNTDGFKGNGVVYKITAAGAETVIHQFQAPTTPGTNSNYFTRVNADGYFPTSSLVQTRNADGTYQDAFLGTTGSGGANGVGTVFRVSREDSFTDVYDFTGGSDGGAPYSGLTRGQDGDYYGLTTTGAIQAGTDKYHITAFRLVPDTSSPTGYTFRTIVDLSSVAGLSQPNFSSGNSKLTQASDGNFYSNGELGGSGGFGAVYRIAPDMSSPTGFSATDVFTFDAETGEDLRAPVIQAADGDLYGTTIYGGFKPDGRGFGTIYRLNLGLPLPPAAPTITSTAYHVNTDGTSYVLVNGTNFVAGCSLTLTNSAHGTTSAVTLKSSTLIENDLNMLLLPGDHTVTVKNPDGQSATATLTTLGAPPTITSATYHVNTDGTSYVLANGTNFVAGCSLTLTNSTLGITSAVTLKSSTLIENDLNMLLPPGDHIVTVTNPDGQSAAATLTTLGAPIVLSPPTAVTDTNGAIHLIVSGFNFALPGYNGDPTGSLVVVQAADARGNLSNVNTTVAVAPATATGPQQFIVTLNSADAGSFSIPDHYTVEVFNADAQFSPPVVFNVYSQDQTQYAVAYDPGVALQAYQLYLQMSGTPVFSATGNARQGQSRALRPNDANGNPPQITSPVEYAVDPIGIATLAIRGTNFVRGGSITVTNYFVGTTIDPTLQGSGQVGTQIVSILSQPLPAGDHNITVTNPDGQSSTVTLTILASSPTLVLLGPVATTPPATSTLIAASGTGTSFTGLVSNSSGTLVSNSSGTVVSHDGGSLVSNSSGTLVSNSSGTLVSNSSGTLVSNSSGTLVSNSSGTAISSAVAALASSAGVTGSLGLTPSFSPTGQVRAAHVVPPTPLSFLLTKHDAGTARGTGSSDLKVSLNHTDGTSTYLLDLRFTPGQPDVVVYQAPGVTLTPRLGGTAPAVTSPVPSLTTVSPNTAPVGGTVTLTATGTFFTTGSVINFNGQALATTVVSGTQATALVPAAMLTSAGPASVTVTNPAPGGGTSASLPFTVIQATHLFAAGMQMFSVPADYSALTLSQALTVAVPKLAVWMPTQAQYAITPTSPADALRPGQGYWARFTAATGLVGAGVPTRTDQAFSIALAAGWNMIGDPFPNAVALSGIQVQDAGGSLGAFSQAVTAGAVSGTLYTHGAGDIQYQTIGLDGSLTPYVGDWVYAYRPCTLQVPAPLSR